MDRAHMDPEAVGVWYPLDRDNRSDKSRAREPFEDGHMPDKP